MGGGVQITSSRFVVGTQMYPLAGITSVSPFTIPPKRFGLILGALFSLLLTTGAVTPLVEGKPIAFLLFAAITGLFVWRVTQRKTVHGVTISTAGMQVRALTSPDVTFVQQVVGALHQAIASR